MVNISDVARAAGVSKATVSYVLSDDPRITEQTAAKVRKAVADLGYTVNHAARALSVKKTMTLGIISPAYHGSYLSALFGLHMYLLSEQAAKFGYDTLSICSDSGDQALNKAWASKKVDGFILMDVSDDDPRLSMAASLGAPTVAFGSPKDSYGLDTVDSDFPKAARRTIEYLAQEGHTEIILLLWSHNIFRRKMGFALRFRDTIIEEAKARGIQVHIVFPEDDESDPAVTIAESLRDYPSATAMVLHNESATIVASQTFTDLGVRVPDDLRVVTLFPKQLFNSMRIPFVSIDIDISVLAETAIMLLLSRIANHDAPMVRQAFDFPMSLKYQ